MVFIGFVLINRFFLTYRYKIEYSGTSPIIPNRFIPSQAKKEFKL